MSVNVVMAGGGTGGHVFPAVAVAQEIQRLNPDAEVCFVGTERGLEARVVPKLGFDLHTLTVRHLKGSGVMGWSRGLAALPVGGMQALSLVRRLDADIVVSVGGYAAGPITLAAAMTGRRTALMEQNSLPGLTNRLLGKVVDRCFISFPQTRDHLPSRKCVVTGNPVRREIIEAAGRRATDHDREARPFRLLITGGSGGAGSINKEWPGVMRRLPAELASGIVVRHQAGRDRHEPVVDAYRGFAGEVEVTEFIDDMAQAYLWADLVVCRAGATTLAELLVLGQPAILVPFPGAADNHQEKNAMAAVEAGAALMIRDDEMATERAGRLLAGLVQNPRALDAMGKQATSLGQPEATERIAQAVLDMATGRGQNHADMDNGRPTTTAHGDQTLRAGAV